MGRLATFSLISVVGLGCAGGGEGTSATASTVHGGSEGGDTSSSSGETPSGSTSAADGTGEGGSSGQGETGAETSVGDTGVPEPLGSRCEVGTDTITCSHESKTLLTGIGGVVPREVHWQTPLGEPPADGWPAVFLFQGSIFSAELFWSVVDTEVFGYWNQGLLTKALLDEGFVVITPEAALGGSTAWETNIPPMAAAWEQSNDHRFMLDLFDALDGGTFGPVDGTRLYAAGISSGGYMTSRMDQAYRSRFRALAIQSASYATCGGPICALPLDLDAAHRPTLFLHGSLDTIVPLWTMELYRDALDALGVETETLVADGVGHAWLDEAPTAVVQWFRAHG